MATDGHPWLTDELDNTRAQQRRTLRGVPDWLLGQWKFRPAPQPVDSAFTEVLVRHHITEMLAANDGLRAELESMATWTRVFTLSRFIGDSEASQPGSALVNVAGQLTAGEREAHYGQVPNELSPQVHALVYLLLWADELAEDEYLDPRISIA